MKMLMRGAHLHICLCWNVINYYVLWWWMQLSMAGPPCLISYQKILRSKKWIWIPKLYFSFYTSFTCSFCCQWRLFTNLFSFLSFHSTITSTQQASFHQCSLYSSLFQFLALSHTLQSRTNVLDWWPKVSPSLFRLWQLLTPKSQYSTVISDITLES